MNSSNPSSRKWAYVRGKLHRLEVYCLDLLDLSYDLRPTNATNSYRVRILRKGLAKPEFCRDFQDLRSGLHSLLSVASQHLLSGLRKELIKQVIKYTGPTVEWRENGLSETPRCE